MIAVPVIEVFGISNAGIFVTIFTLRQYADARKNLTGCEVIRVSLIGSLL